jgi:hypothetical protein
MPGDIPRLSSAEITATLAAHRVAPAFTIVPAHDDLGSNTIVCSPPDVVPLRFGEDVYSWRCFPLWNHHPEPIGSRRATPPLLFQHRDNSRKML